MRRRRCRVSRGGVRERKEEEGRDEANVKAKPPQKRLEIQEMKGNLGSPRNRKRGFVVSSSCCVNSPEKRRRYVSARQRGSTESSFFFLNLMPALFSALFFHPGLAGTRGGTSTKTRASGRQPRVLCDQSPSSGVQRWLRARSPRVI